MPPRPSTLREAPISSSSSIPRDAHGAVGVRSERPAAEGAASLRPSGGPVGHVCVVTVTYGDRRHLLRPVLTSLLEEEAISKIVVVSNGTQWDVCSLARELAPHRIEVVNLPKNLGSAVGFGTGIKTACDLGAEFIWLLDDDNRPEEGALRDLLSALEDLSSTSSQEGLAVSAFRSSRPSNFTTRGATTVPRVRRRSSFWSFHLLDVPRKIWRRTPWAGREEPGNVQRLIRVSDAAYGGLLFRPAVVQKFGLPRPDLVLYEDDTEFTRRITRGGGAIYLVRSALLRDLEEPWGAKSRSGLPVRGWLKDIGDGPAFYAARNLTYVDARREPHNRFIFSVNRRVYCGALLLFAVVFRRLNRYRLLRSAIRDGLAGRLGMHPEHPL